MRLNKYIALHTKHSRRGADELIASKKVQVNGIMAQPGQNITEEDKVVVNGQELSKESSNRLATIMMNKPRGYVCSRDGQGSPTIYELLPPELSHLNSVGRLDKDSSGLLLLTNDGELANRLTHPRYQKIKIYEVDLNKPLQPLHQQMISDIGINLEDGPSKLQIEKRGSSDQQLTVTMKEGRNRQIRRTFEALGYKVKSLNRVVFGEYKIGELEEGRFSYI